MLNKLCIILPLNSMTRMKMKTSYQKQLAISLVRESFLRFQLMLITSKERALSVWFDWLLMTVKWLRNLLICLLNRNSFVQKKKRTR
ncbi:BnaA09g26940D [Brassica napus]|uniref:BnaA09g26940D protein n=1 Tax=Brassica napus TaxID=3708 RepID=A0A078IE63_BRANA|nr:BnaA09g26940D [Brassica napus]